MHISLETSRTTGFRKWADIHQPISGPPARTTPPAPLGPDDAATTATPAEPLDRPWVIPGVGTAF